MLTLESVSKQYGHRWILRDINLQLGVGDRLAVLGKNGSGKSTLLRIVAGLLRPTKGTISMDGDPRTSIGYCALEQALYPHLTVREHLELMGDLRAVPPRVAESLEFVGLDYAVDRPAAELSTGMKARLKLALAIQARPQILILDEPGASLDEHGRALVEQVVAQQAERGCLIFATNDPAERRLANLELALAS